MTAVEVEALKIIGILVMGVTLTVCFTALSIANKKYKNRR